MCHNEHPSYPFECLFVCHNELSSYPLECLFVCHNELASYLSFLIWFNILHTSFFASNQYYSIKTPMDQTVQEGMSYPSMMPCLLHNLHKILNISYPTWNSKCFYLSQFYCHLWSILKFEECVFVCLFVCLFNFLTYFPMSNWAAKGMYGKLTPQQWK